MRLGLPLYQFFLMQLSALKMLFICGLAYLEITILAPSFLYFSSVIIIPPLPPPMEPTKHPLDI